MDKKKIKRIIAREGLIFLVAIVGIIGLLIEKYYIKKAIDVEASLGNDYLRNINAFIMKLIEMRDHYYMNASIFHKIGFWSLILYVIYLPVRFIVWSIKTLRAK